MSSNVLGRWLEDSTVAPDDGENDSLSRFSAIISSILLFFLILGLTATVRLQDIKEQLTNKMALFTGVAMQFLFMPFLGFAAVTMFQGGLTNAMGISLLVVTCSPGGSYSNWWCNLFNAELALSVAMTSVSSILSLGFLPANLFFYYWLAYTVILEPDGGEDDIDVVGAIDFSGIFISLGVVLSAIILGLFAGSQFASPRFHENANHFGSFCGLALILFSVFLGGGGGGAETNFWSLSWSFYLATALPCIGGIVLATFFSRCFRLSPPEVVAISIGCCFRNTAIATSVAITMFDDPDQRAEAVSVPLFYGFVEAVVIGIYCICVWKMGWTKAPPDEKLCVVLTKTYEAGADDHGDRCEGELPKSWFRRLFVPKKVEKEHESPNRLDSSETIEKDDGLRGRFESVDVTVYSSNSTPPGTPSYCVATEEAPITPPSPSQVAVLPVQQQTMDSFVNNFQYRIEEGDEGHCPPDEERLHEGAVDVDYLIDADPGTP